MRHKLLVALDGGKGSSRTVRYVARACAASSDQDPRVILFNVLPNLPPSIEGARPGAAADLRVQFETETMDAAQQMLASMREIMIAEGMPASRIVTEVSEDRGDVVHQIVTTAEKHDCDTVVVGRRGKSMISQIFADSVAEQLVRHPIGMTIWLVE